MTVVRVSAKADYALRAAAELAVPEGCWKSADEIAQTQQVPTSFLAQILADLRSAEIVVSRRGGGPRRRPAPGHPGRYRLIGGPARMASRGR